MTQLVASLYTRQAKAIEKLQDRREAGQGTLEYVGMIAVAAVIIVAVIGVLNKASLDTWVDGFIQKVKSSVN